MCQVTLENSQAMERMRELVARGWCIDESEGLPRKSPIRQKAEEKLGKDVVEIPLLMVGILFGGTSGAWEALEEMHVPPSSKGLVVLGLKTSPSPWRQEEWYAHHLFETFFCFEYFETTV